ncbi:MAG: hypothetical protein FWG61_08955 [Firmicutes bacterium]|nr:hypothetical protein [Bacillota bacterium]
MEKSISILLKSIIGGILLFTMFVGIFLWSSDTVLAADADIAINETTFPDAAFRAYISEQVDKNKDGMLSPTEIALESTLFIGEKGIANLQGIEYFTALTSLYCSSNNLITLDLSSNIALTLLFCDNNRLNSLNVSKCVNLAALHCFKNNLNTLDISNNTKLEMLRCNDNLLTSLDISKNKNLHALDCSNNKLTVLDVGNNPLLASLTCFGNQLVSEEAVVGLNKSVTEEYYFEPKPQRPISSQPVPQAPLPPVTPGAVQTALPTSATVVVNGDVISFDAYNINGNNYFKLRDIALVLIGSSKQFEVGWDAAANAIALISNRAYTKVGGEMAKRGTENKQALPTTSKIYLDSVEVFFTAFNISGNNYFKLRDIGKTFNFGVDWEESTLTVIIDTSKIYI